jgi:Flp pilus assembly pilin Flp
MTEYIVIVAVVVVIAIAVFVVFGDKIKSAFTSAGDSVTGAAGQVDQRIGEH